MSFPKYVALVDDGTILSIAVVESEQDAKDLENLFGDDYDLQTVSISSTRSLKQDYLENYADLAEFVSDCRQE